MKVTGYNQIEVRLLRATELPMEMLATALDMNMKEEPEWKAITAKKLATVVSMNHTTCLEFIDYTFLLSGVSKAIVGQITRHRLASYSGTSQHYQNFSGRGFTLDTQFCGTEQIRFLDSANQLYESMVKDGVPKEEARQYLPVASTQGLLMKINARSLVNLLNLRLCRRNCEEFRVIAWKMFDLVMGHCPELWSVAGVPDCLLTCGCRQGKMACGKPYKKAEIDG